MDIQIKRIIKLGNLVIPVLKGEKGDRGEQGKQGIQGVTGKDGYTPLRGIDYWTQADKDAIKQEINAEIDPKLESKVDKEQGKGLSTNDFTNILKEKLENLENYNDTEIRNLLNGSLKNVNYTASNGMLTFTKNDGSTLSVDLPLELLIESGRYDEANKQIVLVLANGNSINIPVSSLLDDFYGKNETYNKTEVDTLISQKQKQIEALEQEIDELIDEKLAQQEELDILNSDYTEKELEGESVVVKDGLPKTKVKVKGNGNSYQATTKGYNLIDLSSIENQTKYGVEITVDKEKGSMIFNGTCTQAFLIYLPIKEEITAGSVISLGAFNNKISSNNLSLIRTYGLDVNGVSTNQVNVSFDTINSSKENITLNNNITSVQLRLEVNEVYSDFKIFPMLRLGDTLGEFEPYTNGASPNTEYKQDIEVITECSLVQRGKNRYKTSKIIGSIFNSYGIEFTIKSPTVVHIKGTSTSNNAELFVLGSNWTETSDKLNLKAGKEYTASMKVSTKNVWAYVIKDASQTIANLSADGKSKTFVADENGISKILIRIMNGVTVDEDIELQIEEGLIATPIEPYIEPKTIPINLNGNSLAKVGDIKDLLNIGVDGSCRINKNIKEKIFNGLEKFVNVENANSIRYFTNSDLIPDNASNDILCTHLKPVANLWNLTEQIDCIKVSDNNKTQFNLMVKGFTDSPQLIAKLKELYDNGTPMKVLYETTEPETIELPSIEPIELFKGTNIFELVTNLGTTLAVTYKVSNKKKILNLEERISALESAVIGG